MTQIFLYDNSTGSLKLDLHEILLVKEFDTLWDLERNKCKEDKKENKCKEDVKKEDKCKDMKKDDLKQENKCKCRDEEKAAE